MPIVPTNPDPDFPAIVMIVLFFAPFIFLIIGFIFSSFARDDEDRKKIINSVGIWEFVMTMVTLLGLMLWFVFAG